ncbi:excinuclease ABC subunit C [Legionella birminghamensis]|uniref:UvrABC system protein C n=1 Tax=Legionella birminghamensis TaxID=28083 RepID=A0A378IC62_9GAMM|nr:excinuclease ABC subunit UvrC [Legionella birminghamensis]KTC74279.1 excinuclease ABC subunit C [Legionella birminghamensis]STX32603.1 excinuclease ABC subunit [Legionella birminghamensis]
MSTFEVNTDFSAFLSKLTSEPGVYRMLDCEGVVLYVGKASNLKKRVSSYFNKQTAGVKTRSLVNQISTIEVTVTSSETEALLLESSLIKTMRPRYNVLMRDDKTYPYIQVSSGSAYPRIEMFRSKRKPQKGMVFGPYPSAGSVRETLGVIQKVFKIRNCRDSYFNARSRPCLQYQIKRCSAPCTAYISPEEYQQSINDAVRFLQGKCGQILDELAKRMDDAVERLAFEEAAFLRDQIKSLRLIQEQQGIVQLRGDADVVAMDVQPGFACIQCLTIRNGQVIASQSFYPNMPKKNIALEEYEPNDLRQQVFEAFVSYYYLETPERIPALIILDEPLSDEPVIQSMLSDLHKKEVQINSKPRGIKARWLELANKNLRLNVAEHMASTITLEKRYNALIELLGLSVPVTRMECFDISHTQGDSTVASCVVFNQEGPWKSEYRRFNIQGITPGDDYAAMQQAITRRFKRLAAMQNLPDILIIDGGKGQVAVAEKVLSSLGINSVFLLGIAKGPERKAGWERLILVSMNKEMTLPVDSPALHLLQHIRDEAHRFAITSHRKKRLQTGLDSSLLSIEGVGPKRRQALMNRFGGMRELAKAPYDEIVKVSGINAELALRIFQHFHPES